MSKKSSDIKTQECVSLGSPAQSLRRRAGASITKSGEASALGRSSSVAREAFRKKARRAVRVQMKLQSKSK
jgi:hypothetical protein